MLCYSTGSLPDGLSASRIAETLLPTPFRGVELVLTPETLARAQDQGYWHGFRTELEARGFAVRNVHLGMPFLLGPQAHSPGLGSLDPQGRARRVDAALAAAQVSAWVGSPHVTLTTGLPEREGDAGAQEGLVWDSLRRIAAKRPEAVKISLEQEPEHVIRLASQLQRICRAFAGEVFANFDVGHSAVAGEDIPAAIRLLGPHLSNVHLEDIQGQVHRHLLFGEGDIDFHAVFAALRASGYRGDLTPDLYPFKDDAARALSAAARFLAAHGYR